MSAARKALGVVLAVGGALGIAWLSRAPTSHAEPDQSLLRLSWRVLGVRIEECRRLSEEELEALAPHMRTPETCIGRNADYELRVRVGSEEVVRDTIRPAGVRADRPIYVLRDVALAPGSYEVSVQFTALVPAGSAGVASGGPEVRGEPAENERDDDDRERAARDQDRRDEPAERIERETPDQPLELMWTGDVVVGPAEIALITLDPTGTRLAPRAR